MPINIKMNNGKIIRYLVVFIGLVFLSAAIYRIFNYNVGLKEFNQLGIPIFFLPFVILLEIILGLFFLLNKKVFYASLSSIIFLTIAIIIGFFSNFKIIIENISELFVFNATPTNIWLHILYIILLWIILIEYKNNK